MAELLRWSEEVAPTIVKGSPLGKAWSYLDKQQGPLQVFPHNGMVSIDNNAAERGLRRHTIGRKLWLFFRNQDTLQHVARLMSIPTTARSTFSVACLDADQPRPYSSKHVEM